MTEATEVEANAIERDAKFVAKLVRKYFPEPRSHFWRRHPGARPQHVEEQLHLADLELHVGTGPYIGLSPIAPGSDKTKIGLVDFDSHSGETPWPDMVAKVREFCEQAKARGLIPNLFRSSGGNGIHAYFLFSDEQDARSFREEVREALAAAGLKDGTGGVKAGFAEVFAKQNSVPSDGWGSMFVLAFAGKSERLRDDSLEPMAREEAVALELHESAPVRYVERQKIERPASGAAGSGDVALIRSALASIPNEGAESLEYNPYRNVGFAVHHATGGSAEGLALFHEFSSRSEKYNPDFVDSSFWPHVRSDRDSALITERTLYKLARDHGWIEPVELDFENLDDPKTPAAETTRPRLASADPQAREQQPGVAGVEQDQAPAARAALRTANDIDEAALLRPDYLVKGWIDRRDNALLFGEWNAGKTFVVLNMAVHVAAAVAWFGHRVKQAPGLYCTYEGGRGIEKRVAALRQQFPDMDWSNLPFAWQVLRYPLTTKEGREELQAAVKAFHARFGKAPGLVIIDPLKDALGGDDSDAELMGKLNLVVLNLIASYGCAVLRVHHSGHSDKTRSRGHSSLPASADVEIQVSDGAITGTKQRDKAKGELYFKRTVIELGVDQEGDSVTTCIIEPAASPTKKREPTGRIQKIVWQMAHDLAEIGEDDHAVPQEALLKAVKEKLVAPARGIKDRRWTDAARALGKLTDLGFLALDGEKVRVPRAS